MEEQAKTIRKEIETVYELKLINVQANKSSGQVRNVCQNKVESELRETISNLLAERNNL